MADPRIIDVELDERTILWRSADVEQERRIAIFDLIEGNRFQPQRKHPDGYAGMERIRGILTEQSKALYTEALIAESYSDFKVAYQKFKEILSVAPNGSLYHERATRKIANYKHFRPEEEEATPQ